MADVGHTATSATKTYFGYVFIDDRTVYILMKNNKNTI